MIKIIRIKQFIYIYLYFNIARLLKSIDIFNFLDLAFFFTSLKSHIINILKMSLAGTVTEQNLAKSFAGECMARTKYTYYAGAAKKEGYEQIAALFLETAENEREHAKIFFNFLKRNGGTAVEVPASVALTGIGKTVDNLKAAAAGEHEETTNLYPQFAKDAEREGFKNIARAFTLIAKVEKEHEIRYNTLLKHVESGTVFKRAKSMRWKCRNCGFVFEGVAAPRVCPACFHPQAYFELKETLE